MVHVLVGQRLHQLGLEPRQLTEVIEIAQLLGHDVAVLSLLEDEDVHDADGAGVIEPEELLRALAAEVLVSSREFDDQVVDGPQLVDRAFSHGHSLSLAWPRAEPGDHRRCSGVRRWGH
jgi:hypothetical protein